MSKEELRSRAWTFTINNDTDKDLDLLLDASFRYLCFGFEKVDTRHIQGYIYFFDAKTKSAMKKIMPRAHYEVSKGTSKENAVYTSKEDHWYEFGDRPHQGEITWNRVEEVMKDPTSNIHIYNQFRKVYRELQLSKPKTHERKLRIADTFTKYDIAAQIDEPICQDIETYDGENIIFMHTYADNWVMDWLHNMPRKIKRGYELICIDPEYVCIFYDDVKERNYLLNLYANYLE